jgi:hypothetical protein
MNRLTVSLALMFGVAAVLIPLVGCAAPDDPPSATTETTESPVLRISTLQTQVPEGESPKITITLTNNQGNPITLVKPGDGSDCGWRTPIVGWSVLPFKEGETARHPADPPLIRGLRCGNINPLKQDEVITIGADKSAPLREWAGVPAFPAPGRYSVVFYYRNDPALVWKGLPLGQHDPEAMKQVRNSLKCALRSNELQFVVKARKDN